MDEKMLEEILLQLLKEACKEVAVPEAVLVEKEEKEFQALLLFRSGNKWGVVKCRGREEVFKKLHLLLAFKRQLAREVEKELSREKPIAVFEGSVCLN